MEDNCHYVDKIKTIYEYVVVFHGKKAIFR